VLLPLLAVFLVISKENATNVPKISIYSKTNSPETLALNAINMTPSVSSATQIDV
jgi:hypothetical protein